MLRTPEPERERCDGERGTVPFATTSVVASGRRTRFVGLRAVRRRLRQTLRLLRRRAGDSRDDEPRAGDDQRHVREWKFRARVV